MEPHGWGTVMKIVLQQETSGLFFKNPASWTTLAEDAHSFPRIASAVDYCLRNDLKQVLIVLQFLTDHYEIRLSDAAQAARTPGISPPLPSSWRQASGLP